MKRIALLLLVLAGAAATAAHAGTTPAQRFAATVDTILAQPYQPDYVPLGFDAAFDSPVLNTAPAQDYTSGSTPGSPDHPDWPAAFRDVVIQSADGALLTGKLALHPGTHPGVVVVHGFNTNGKESVVRWAAMLARNGFDVLAADQRDFKAESDAGYGYPGPRQTFGWKEAEDVLEAGRFLAAQPGVSSIGLVGFSLGGQDTVLALALDRKHVFSAGLSFSGPADQATQVDSTAVPAGCETPACTYPATDALTALVVPPYDYTDACTVLDDAATYYATDPFSILSHENAFHRQLKVGGAAAERLLGRRLAGRAVRGADDGRLRGRQPAPADGRAPAWRARLLLRPLVAAAGDPPLLQEPAPRRRDRPDGRDGRDRRPDAWWRGGRLTTRRPRRADTRRGGCPARA